MKQPDAKKSDRGSTYGFRPLSSYGLNDSPNQSYGGRLGGLLENTSDGRGNSPSFPLYRPNGADLVSRLETERMSLPQEGSARTLPYMGDSLSSLYSALGLQEPGKDNYQGPPIIIINYIMGANTDSGYNKKDDSTYKNN